MFKDLLSTFYGISNFVRKIDKKRRVLGWFGFMAFQPLYVCYTTALK